MYDAASTVLAQRLSQVDGVGQVNVGGGALPAVRVELDPDKLAAKRHRRSTTCAPPSRHQCQPAPRARVEEGDRTGRSAPTTRARTAADYAPVLLSYRNGAAVRLRDVAERQRLGAGRAQLRRCPTASRRSLLIVLKEPGANIIETVQRVRDCCRVCRRAIPRRSTSRW